jgi:hypothetical protein
MARSVNTPPSLASNGVVPFSTPKEVVRLCCEVYFRNRITCFVSIERAYLWAFGEIIVVEIGPKS